MGLLRTIAIILLVYYGFKFLAKLFAPYLMKRMVNKMQEKAQGQQQRQQQPNVKVGETVIDKKPQNKNQSNNSVGEYVDYEEVEDENK
ncbi:MAG: DUF4834 family protein [Polaribacter sp.]|jgi:hypothetical protein|nr:DUF4834 family protein [Polaribacter sp.]MDG1954352.1 DUF4834 family protein [Polaribacter sp.]MDG2073705.1 DUF4834 family protein [Polaribacter sp.]